MKKLLVLSFANALVALSLGLGAAALAQEAKPGDAAAGEKKIAMCEGCHNLPRYQASFPEIYKVPINGTTRELALVTKGRTASDFIDPAKPDAGTITWQGSRSFEHQQRVAAGLAGLSVAAREHVGETVVHPIVASISTLCASLTAALSARVARSPRRSVVIDAVS